MNKYTMDLLGSDRLRMALRAAEAKESENNQRANSFQLQQQLNTNNDALGSAHAYLQQGLSVGSSLQDQESANSALLNQHVLNFLSNDTSALLRQRQLLEEAQQRESLLAQSHLLGGGGGDGFSFAGHPRIGSPRLNQADMDQLLQLAGSTGLIGGHLPYGQPLRKRQKRDSTHMELTRKERKSTFPLPSLNGPDYVPRPGKLTSFRNKWTFLAQNCDQRQSQTQKRAFVQEVFARSLHQKGGSDHLFRKVHGLGR